MKKLSKTIGGLFIGLILFSCSTEELANKQTHDNPNQINNISEINIDKIVNEMLTKNTEILNTDYSTNTVVNENGVLKSSNSSKLSSLLIDQYCGENKLGETLCSSSLYDLGGFSDENIVMSDRFVGPPFTSSESLVFYTWNLPNPYTSLGWGAYLNTTDSDLATLLPIEYLDVDPETLEYTNFFRYEILAETNSLITINSATYSSWARTIPSENVTSFNNSGGDLDPNGNVNILLKNFNNDDLIMVIAEDISNPVSNFGLNFEWRIPGSVSTGEYYIEIQDVTDSDSKNHEHYITKLIVENTEEITYQTEFVPNGISSPSGTYNYNIGTNRGEITVEWDPEIFDESFVYISVTSIDLTKFPSPVVDGQSAWVLAHNGQYTIPADSYGDIGQVIITIQSTTKSTSTAFIIQ